MSNIIPPSERAPRQNKAWPPQSHEYPFGSNASHMSTGVELPNLYTPTPRRVVMRRVVVIAGVIAVIAAIYTAYTLHVTADLGDAPAATVRAFCAGEMNDNYELAYSQVAPATADIISHDDFIAYSGQRNAQYGTVRHCAVERWDFTHLMDDSHAALVVGETLNDGHHEGTMLVSHQGDGSWRIETVDQGLHLLQRPSLSAPARSAPSRQRATSATSIRRVEEGYAPQGASCATRPPRITF